MNIQRKNSAHHFRMQSEREQTLGTFFNSSCIKINIKIVQNCCRKLMVKGLKTTFGTVKS